MLVVLLHNHTHAGKEYKKGDRVDLPKDAVDWLLKVERITRQEAIEEPPSKQPSIFDDSRSLE